MLLSSIQQLGFDLPALLTVTTELLLHGSSPFLYLIPNVLAKFTSTNEVLPYQSSVSSVSTRVHSQNVTVVYKADNKAHSFLSKFIVYHIISYLKFIVPPLHNKRPWVHYIVRRYIVQLI